MKSRVEIRNEVPNINIDGKRHLHFQECIWKYDSGHPSEKGYRFIWRDGTGKILCHRGQARIPSKLDMDNLIILAKQAGWYK